MQPSSFTPYNLVGNIKVSEEQTAFIFWVKDSLRMALSRTQLNLHQKNLKSHNPKSQVKALHSVTAFHFHLDQHANKTRNYNVLT